MDPIAFNGEDDNKEEGEHFKDKGEYVEDKIPHIEEVTRMNAMITNMPCNHNTDLAKRRAIQSAMQDQGLSAVEQNRKIQDIMAGRVKLPSVVGKEVVAKSSMSKFSRSMCINNGQSMDPFASNREDDNKEGGEHSKDKGEYAEEEFSHIGEVT